MITTVGCGLMLGGAAKAIAHHSTQHNLPYIVRVFLWLRSCVTPRTAVQSLPYAAFAVEFWLALLATPLLLDLETLRETRAVEFFCIHSSGFLGLVGLASPSTRRGRALKYGALAQLLAMYLRLAVSNLSQSAALTFAYLTLAKLLEHYWRRPDEAARVGLALRWFTQSVLFLFVGIAADSLDFNDRGALAWGAGYYSVLALLDSFDAFSMPRSENEQSELLG
jgi:hypothetical protein